MRKIGRYALFFFAPVPEEVVDLIQKQLRGHDCNICSKKENCSLKEKFPVKPIAVYDEDNLNEMNDFIRYVYEQLVSEFAILVDTETDKLFLYIGGEDWKMNLDDIIYYLEFFLRKTFNTENVVDLRETLKFKAISGIN